MATLAVRASGLSKQYRLGVVTHRHHTLRDLIVTRLTALTRRTPEGPEPRHFWALRDVSFEVQQGEVIGFVGRNGAGKSTLLKILSRITQPTEGRVEVYGRIGSLLEVGTGFHPELSGRENVYFSGAVLGMSKQEIERNFDEILAFAEVEQFIDTPVKHYSSGMYVRLAFAVAAHLQSEILIVDEVLAVGDAAFQKKCLAKMESVAHEGRTVLFVSHNADTVRRLCTRAILLDAGKVVDRGPPDLIIGRYEGRKAREVDGLAPHVVFQAPPEALAEQFAVTRIETLGAAFEPLAAVRTWDPCVIRIHYHARQVVLLASLTLEIGSPQGTRLLSLSTRPDSDVPMAIEIGHHSVDCVIDQMPLAAGEYPLNVGLGIENTAWLVRREDIARLVVHPSDVFDARFPPTAPRALIATPHSWRIDGQAPLTIPAGGAARRDAR